MLQASLTILVPRSSPGLGIWRTSNFSSSLQSKTAGELAAALFSQKHDASFGLPDLSQVLLCPSLGHENYSDALQTPLSPRKTH